MSHLKRGACALLAIIAAASMRLASADIIDSQHPYLTTNGDTQTDIVYGGEVAHMVGYDTSIINIVGGQVSYLTMNDSAWVRLISGDVSRLTLNGSAQATVAGGAVSHLNLNASARATVANGQISWLRAFDNSALTILGAASLSWLVVGETSQVDIFVADASFSHGYLSGTWLDGSPFGFGVIVGSFGTPGTVPAQLPPNITIHFMGSAPSAR